MHPSLRYHRLRAAVATALAMNALAAAPAVALDSLIADVSGTRYPDSASGFAGSLLLQHTVDNGGLLYGMTATRVPAGSLFVVDADIYHGAWSRYTFTAGASLGNAETPGESDTLYKGRLAIDARINAQWSVRVGDQYIELAAVRGNLVDAHVQYMPTLRWSVNVGGGYAPGGTLAGAYGEVAVHWYGPEHVFGGFVAGRTGYDPANLGLTAIEHQQREEYLGVSVPIRSLTLNLLIDNTALDGASRQTLHIGVRKALPQ
jgi:hypothetical protein